MARTLVSNLVEMVNDFIEVVVDSTNLEILEMWRYFELTTEEI